MIEFDIPWPVVIGLVVSVVLPLVVGLVTKTVTNSSVKATILAALAALTGLGVELADAISNGTPYNLGLGVVLALGAFVVAVGLHFGIYKPTGVATAMQEVGMSPEEKAQAAGQ